MVTPASPGRTRPRPAPSGRPARGTRARTSLARSGGQYAEADGPFGLELRARISPADPVHGGRQGALEPVRFLGVDGPRWFLRGLISGPAASHEARARPLEQVFAAVVVVRGDHPVPPRELLEIRLPD